MAETFTPGPWEVVSEFVGPLHIRQVGQPWSVAHVGHEEFATCVANARLIAAAPDSHEANKASLMVLCAIRDAHEWHPNMLKDIDFAIEANRHALSRAKDEGTKDE